MKRTVTATTFLIAGVLLGGLLLAAVVGLPARSRPAEATAAETKYTCSMHPQIIMDHADFCPLCGMDLTPVRSDSGDWEDEDPGVRLALSEAAQRMADVGSVEIRRRTLFKEIRTVGKVELDETRVADVAARLRGPIQQLFADSPGTPVRKGEPLVSIFSTEVFPAQQEFLFARGQEVAALNRSPGSALNKFYLPRRRLEFWGMTEEQIDRLGRAAEGEDYLVVSAPISGIIVNKKVRLGQFVQEGEVLYTIADLSQVWLVLEMYESEISWLRLGQPVEITLESEPHRPANGKVGFIEPVLNDATRTIRVRVVLENPEGRFKPGMYAQALLRIPILSDGSAAPTGLEGKYICPMHPFDISEDMGKCPRCERTLEQIPGAPASNPSELDPMVLALPAEALLTTGRRQLAYLEIEPGKYKLVEPKLGPRAGDYYPIVAGFDEGDRVVTRGGFLVDSQFQITGKTSLLYPKDDSAAATPVGFTAKEWGNIKKLPKEEQEHALAQKICPNCGMNLGALGMPPKLEVEGRTIYLCCNGCGNAVKKDPQAAFDKIEAARAKDTYRLAEHAAHTEHTEHAGHPESPTAEQLANIAKLPAEEQNLAVAQRICPACGMNLGMKRTPYKTEIDGRMIFLCCPNCEEAVKKDPEAALKKIGAAKAEEAHAMPGKGR